MGNDQELGLGGIIFLIVVGIMILGLIGILPYVIGGAVLIGVIWVVIYLSNNLPYYYRRYSHDSKVNSLLKAMDDSDTEKVRALLSKQGHSILKRYSERDMLNKTI